MENLVSKALTEIKEPSTKAAAPNIDVMAKWAGFRLEGPPQIRQQLEQMLSAVGRFVVDMQHGTPPRLLSLLGTSGAGKTMLAKRVWRWFEKSGMYYTEPIRGATCVRTGQFCSWRSFLEECLQGDFSRTADLRSDWFVVLDDIGAKRDKSGFGVDKLDTILADRSERNWTLITGNLGLEEIAQLDVRIASRMLRGGSEVVEINVPDYALRQAVDAT